MKIIFKDALIYDGGVMKKQSVLFDGTALCAFDFAADSIGCARIFENTVILPGFCDVHVHFREPGFSYKETMESGTRAAAAGGYTAVCTMPNLSPTPDTREHLDEQLEAIRRAGGITVIPYGTITKAEAGEELSDMADMAKDVAGFSDDGRGVQSEEMMEAAMRLAKSLGKPIVAHCEDNSLLRGGYIHDGEYAAAHGHRGICSESEWGSGTRAAAAGGYTAVCTMPNLSPTPDTREHLDEQLEAIRRAGGITVIPYGTITKAEAGEELSDMADMAKDVAGFSDDGRGVQSEEMMEAAMRLAKSLGKPIVAHCEDNSLLRGGYIHDGEYAAAHGHRGICSESEWGPIARDIELVKKTGCAYHVCHISTKESVDIIRRAKAEGVDVSCETGPHYLTLDDSCLLEDGRFKMNPPLRAAEDREALVAGLLDGTVDMIATDHAPHSAEEKSRGLEKSLMGVVGLETAFPVLYTKLVKPGVISLEALAELMSKKPRERFGITSDAGFTVFDVGEEYEVDPEKFLSKGKSTPFAGMRVFGKCLATVTGGRAVYLDEKIIKNI